MRRARVTRLAALAVLIASVLAAGIATPVAAHDEIESSDPVHQSQFDEPISSATIDFGTAVGNVELALVGPDDRELPGTVTKLSDSEAQLDFELLSSEGEYFIRYLAEEDGHLVSGAVSFVYGSRSGTGASSTTWIAFVLVAVFILAAGAFATMRRARRADDADTEAPAL